MDTTKLENRIAELERGLQKLKQDYIVHNHTISDGTSMLRKRIQLDPDQSLNVGYAGHLSDLKNYGNSDEVYTYGINVGPDTNNTGFGNKSENMQINLTHIPKSTQSFFFGFRKPLISPFYGNSVSTTASGNTVTIVGYDFTTNELAGALIHIFNSSDVYIETQTIASNTSTVATISGSWLFTTSSAKFFIGIPVYNGSAQYIWQRDYVQEGTAGGVRFGVGPTWTSGTAQNGLLYMNATGDLYWRNKSGTSTKLN